MSLQHVVEKYERAKRAIQAVHADTSVHLVYTSRYLKELRDELDVLIEAVEEDLRQ